MKRIVAFGDSVPLARPQEDGEEAVFWEETWPWQLERILDSVDPTVEVVNCSQRDRTVTSFAKHDFDEHIAFKLPEVIVIQLGIVDCGPRIFTTFEKQLMNLPVVPKRVRDEIIRRRAADRQRITAKDPLAKVQVKPPEFRKGIETLGARLRSLPAMPQVYWVPILCNPDQMERKSPGFMHNVDLYNAIIRELGASTGYQVVDHATTHLDFRADGYHLSVAGNARLARTLAGTIGPRLSEAPAMPRRLGADRA